MASEHRRGGAKVTMREGKILFHLGQFLTFTTITKIMTHRTFTVFVVLGFVLP